MTALATLLRRAAALIILAAVILAPVVIGLSLLQSWQERKEAIDERRMLLGRLTAVVARASEIGKQTEANNAAPARSWFVSGESEALISAQLQQRLQEITAASGAQFQRSNEITAETQDGLTYQGIQISISGPLESIQKTLFEVETGVPFLFVTQAQIDSNSVSQDEQSPLVLQAELTIFAALLPKTLAGSAVRSQ
jgi:hypothetical protein